MYAGEDKPEQWFCFYQNGELVNVKSNLCLDITLTGGEGNVGVSECEDREDQMWRTPSNLYNGEYCYFKSRHSSKKCLDDSDRSGVAMLEPDPAEHSFSSLKFFYAVTKL